MSKSKLIIAVLFTFIFVSVGASVSSAATERDVEIAAVTLAREMASSNGYNLMTVDELKKAMDEGKDMLLVDTMRYEQSYKINHIPGAKHFTMSSKPMPTWDTSATEGKTQEDFIKLLGPDKNRMIVIYCGFVMCPRSHTGIDWAKKLGYTNLYRVPGGVNAWRDSGYPLAKVE